MDWFQISILLYPCCFPPLFDLFGKQIEAQRTWRLVKGDILALKLIVLHKEIGFWITGEVKATLQGNLNILRYKSTKISFSITLWQWFSPSTHTARKLLEIVAWGVQIVKLQLCSLVVLDCQMSGRWRFKINFSKGQSRPHKGNYESLQIELRKGAEWT